MNYFCTLFDSNYLAKGLTMYDSLYRACREFHLYLFAFDDIAYNIVTDLAMENVTVISLSDFEDSDLLRIKPTRSTAEYCWTATSSTIMYCLNRFNIDHCVYIDADLYFYSDPVVLTEELADNDVLITEHRYTPEYDRSVLSGKYCVQFILFRNSINGLRILEWWRKSCIEWCYARVEDGKFGDQKYLDDWLDRFEGVKVLEHSGGGVAPWNVQQYDLKSKKGKISGSEKNSHDQFDLVFYHFHNVNNHLINGFNEFNLGSYFLEKKIIRLIYKPYLNELKKKDKLLKMIDNSFDSLGSRTTRISFLRLIGHLMMICFRRNKVIWIR